MKNRGNRRQKTERVVKKRLRIIKHAWSMGCPPFEKKPGRLRKYNLACGCEMCKLARKSRKPLPPRPDCDIM